MSEFHGRTFAELLQVVGASAALALVGWQGVASVQRNVEELASRSLEERGRALHDTLEERIRTKIGAHIELWSAAHRFVPPGQRIVVAYSEDARGRELYQRGRRLRALVCPSYLKGAPYDPSRPDDLGAVVLTDDYVLDLDSGRDYSALPACEELARGDGFRLLRVRARNSP